MATLVKKITAKGLGSVPKAHSMAQGEKKELFTILGRIDSVEQKNTTYGDYIEFKGVFEAYVNGVLEQSSNIALLPQVAELALLGAFNSQDTDSVEFALQIGVEQSDSSPATGYVYTVQPLIEIQSASPLRHLAALIPAPVAAIETAETAEPAKATKEKAAK